MIILGLTGSIAMGKSTVAGLFKKHGLPVISADDIVHQLYQGRAAPLIEAAFPGSTDENGVNRQKLIAILNKQPEGIKKLEAIIHPLVRHEEWAIIKREKANNSEMIIVEIPLLFETGAEALMDAVVVVTAPPEVQRKRAFERPMMTEEKFSALLANQMPDADKRKKADHIINTGQTLEQTETEVITLIKTLKKNLAPNAYETWKNQFSKASPSA